MCIGWLPLLLLLPSFVRSDPFATPAIKIDAVGRLGAAGTFAGYSPYSDTNQFESITPLVSSLIMQINGVYQLAALTNGEIFAICQAPNSTDIYFAGSFSTVHNISLSNIARFDTRTHSLTSLDQGLDGPVYSLLCDSDVLYAGGDFKAPIGLSNDTATAYGGGAAVWQTNGSWAAVPWKGFNGPVYTITRNPKTNTILFGGRFEATGDGQYFNAVSSQPVDLSSPTVTSSGNGALPGNFSDPANVVCPNSTPQQPGTPWLLQDDVPGYWEASFPYPVQPSMFRIANTNYEGRGTRTFSAIALGSNEYFILSYIDPVTQQNTTCSDSCTLTNNTDVVYQDFTVQNAISTSGIRLNIDSWYGEGGGLRSVQVFQSDIAMHAHLGSNTSQTCSSTPSASTAITGDWQEKFAYGSYQNFLTSTIPTSELSTTNASITYYPYIPVQGQYAVYANTPGCVSTSTCNERTQIDLTLQLSPGNTTTVTIDQAVTEDSSTLVFSGFVTATSAAFKPMIELRVAQNATPPDGGTVSIVADSISFIRNGTGAALASILEYDPHHQTLNSTTAWHPLADQLAMGSVVRSIDASKGDVLYIGGQFMSPNGTYRNIVSYDYRTNSSGQLLPLAESGLNGNVSKVMLVGSSLFVGGAFTNTVNGSRQELDHVARLDTISNTWYALEGGVDGPVDNIVLSGDQKTITFSGNFQQVQGVNKTTKKTSIGNALWNTSLNHWVERPSLLVGNVASTYELASNTSLVVGRVRGAQTYHSNAATLLDSDNTSWSPLVLDENAVVNAGTFWRDTASGNRDDAVLILGGRFSTDNTTAVLMIHPNGTSQSIGRLSGEVNALAILDNQLYIGGHFDGTIGNNKVTSFVIYDLARQTSIDTSNIYDSTGGSGIVKVLAVGNDRRTIYVGGNIAAVGSLQCNVVCSFDSQTSQWNRVASGLDGNVHGLTVNGDQLTAVGDLIVNGMPAFVAQTDKQANTWTAILTPQSSQIDSAPTAVLNGQDKIILAGGNANASSAYLGTWDGQKFTNLGNLKLGPTSNIRQLMYMPIASSPNRDRFPANTDSMLLVAGHLDISNFGNASAALYDGSSWYPFALTTRMDGSAGFIQQIFSERSCCGLADIRHYLPVPAVILISIAISLGIIFVLVGLGLLGMFLKRKNGDPDMPEPMTDRPTSFAAMIDSLAVGTTAAQAAAAKNREKEYHAYSTPQDAPSRSGAAPIGSFMALVESAAAGSSQTDPNPMATDTSPRLYRAKYPFEAKEFGELGFDADSLIVVTDMSDNIWWMGSKDDGTGKPISGLFPSNFVAPSPSSNP